MSGNQNQKTGAVAIGFGAGRENQNEYAVAVGTHAGYNNQGNDAIAIGLGAGFLSQGSNAIAIGYQAGYTSQGTRAIAIGYLSGDRNQGQNSVAIGYQAGFTSQGTNAIAIGYQAGLTNQAQNSIALNASGTALPAINQGFYVAPIRKNTGASNLVYTTSTKEITHSAIEYNAGTFENDQTVYHDSPTKLLLEDYVNSGWSSGWSSGTYTIHNTGHFKIHGTFTIGELHLADIIYLSNVELRVNGTNVFSIQTNYVSGTETKQGEVLSFTTLESLSETDTIELYSTVKTSTTTPVIFFRNFSRVVIEKIN